MADDDLPFTLDDARRLLTGVTYKPGSAFELDEHDYLRIRIPAQDSTDLTGETAITIHSSDGPFPHGWISRDAFIAKLRHMLAFVEDHEVDEWLRIGPERNIEPHPKLDHAFTAAEVDPGFWRNNHLGTWRLAEFTMQKGWAWTSFVQQWTTWGRHGGWKAKRAILSGQDVYVNGTPLIRTAAYAVLGALGLGYLLGRTHG